MSKVPAIKAIIRNVVGGSHKECEIAVYGVRVASERNVRRALKRQMPKAALISWREA